MLKFSLKLKLPLLTLWRSLLPYWYW